MELGLKPRVFCIKTSNLSTVFQPQHIHFAPERIQDRNSLKNVNGDTLSLTEWHTARRGEIQSMGLFHPVIIRFQKIINNGELLSFYYILLFFSFLQICRPTLNIPWRRRVAPL